MKFYNVENQSRSAPMEKRMASPLPKLPIRLLFSACIFLLLPLFSNSADPLGNYCGGGDSATYDGQLIDNIHRMLSDLVSKASTKGFATASSGSSVAPVFGLAQCRRDVNADDCKSCLASAAFQLPNVCQNQTNGRIWYDYCFVRYDTREFAGDVDTGAGIIYWNIENVTDPRKFDEELGALMKKVKAQAVALPASQGLGKGETEFSSYQKIYALVQCTEDLQALGCAQCLAIAEDVFTGLCYHRKGCRVLYGSCYVRYEFYPFFFPLDQRKNSKAAVDASANSMLLLHPKHP